MASSDMLSFVELLAWFSLGLGVLCCAYIAFDQRRRPAPHMAIMKWVWPINALWAGPAGLWAYRALGNGGLPPLTASGEQSGALSMEGMSDMKKDMPGMEMDMPDMKMDMSMPMKGMHQRSFPQSVAVGTLHCGAGCSLADLVGPWLFRLMPFSLGGSLVFGEWGLDYILALAFGVIFQYAGLAAMSQERGLSLWWRALRVDFLSLSAWQVGMYGWMAIALFGLHLPLAPDGPLFWFMMQVAMLCGFVTAYPMNWWLIRLGVKKAM